MWTMGVDVIDPNVAATVLNSFAFDDLLCFRVSSNVNLTVRTVLASPSRHRPSCEAFHPSPSAPHPTPPRTPATPSASKPCGRPTVPSLKLMASPPPTSPPSSTPSPSSPETPLFPRLPPRSHCRMGQRSPIDRPSLLPAIGGGSSCILIFAMLKCTTSNRSDPGDWS